MAYAELATLRPHAGGEYVYLREAFGPLAAFLTGWTSFVAGFSGAIAAGAVALAEYLGRFVPAAADKTPLADAAAAVPAARRDAAGARRDRRDRRAVDRAPARLGPLRPQHPRGREGPRARDVHRARAVDRRTGRSRSSRPRTPCREPITGWLLALDAGDVQPTRGGTPRRTSPRRFAIRAATCRSRSRSARWRWSSSISR